ncbi:MSEP-CTERM sorting domain-containing protein [Chryseobacterium sp. KACC 21268]|nr:MSEP-CTERM sorting domain-containing protein [Chryseobacterium sp. KACC 21268]
MKSLLSPKWIFLINTLPVLVLLILGFQEFSVIKTLLKPETIWLWKSCTFWLVALGMINFGFAVFLVLKNYKIKTDFAFFMLISNIVFLYFYYYNFNEIIPPSVPQWMLSGETMFYVGTFLMPTLAYSLFILVVHFTPENKLKSPWRSFGLALCVPLLFYLVVQLIVPLFRNFQTDYNNHLILVFIAGTLFFLFFLLRGIFILIQMKSDFFRKYQLIWKILFAIILPIIGLLVNAGIFSFDFSSSNERGIFGDFNGFWFWLLAVFNGVLLCIPNVDNKNIRLILFVLRSVTFAFTFYFFIVFLPFLPLSVVAIVAVGFGFLMLSPLILFIFHISQLAEDFSFLKINFSKNVLKTISVIGFLVIPTAITIKYLNDKKILNQTLEFLYTPDYSKRYDIDKQSLRKTLNVVTSYKNNRDMFSNDGNIPYLTSYFNWLVLDNLTLSDAKITNIEKVFFGKSSEKIFTNTRGRDRVFISNISTQTTFDSSQKAWRTWVNFEMTDHTDGSRPHEFSTIFNLPDGCFVSDYYLMIGDRKEFGILAEKKSAMWIYNQITSENRDPGVLHYLTGNKIAFKVFPFVTNETRKTGIEFLHKEPLKITIENQEIQLGNVTENSQNHSFENQFVKYVSAEEKKSLKPIKRNPYFVFLLDASKGKANKKDVFISQIETLKKQYPQLVENSKTYFVNTYTNSYPLNDKNIDQKFEGGYFLDRAIRTELIKSYEHSDSKFPFFIAVTDSIQNAVLDKDFADLEFTFPDNKLFYQLGDKGILTSFSLVGNPKNLTENNPKIILDNEVLPYKIGNKTYYLENDEEPSLILKSSQFVLSDEEIKEKNWNSAILMQGKYWSGILHPEVENEDWISSVKHSFNAKVMMPVTSYLALENEAQKAVLKRKQDQILNSNKSLDAGEEEMQQMSEPELIVVGILILIFVAFQEYRKRKIKLNLQSKR